jgi:hypothetical protein
MHKEKKRREKKEKKRREKKEKKTSFPALHRVTMR